MIWLLHRPLQARYENDADDNGFSAAFSAGMSDDPIEATPPADPAPVVDEPTDDGEGAGDATGRDEPTAGDAAGTDPADPAPQAGAPAGEAGQTPDTVAGDGGVPTDNGQAQQPAQAQQPQLDANTLAYVLQQMQHGRQPQAQQPQQPQQPAQPQVPASWEDYLSDEERSTLARYQTEWGEVSEAEQIRINAMLRHQREQMQAEMQQALAPFAEQMQQTQVQTHFSRIRDAHDDFDDLRGGKLQQWVATIENPFIRSNAEQVLTQGSTDDVIALIDFYKQQTGTPTGAAPAVPASSSTPAQPSGQAQAPAQPPKPKPQTQATKATAAVPSGSRGTDPRGNDPDDFSAAFHETATAG